MAFRLEIELGDRIRRVPLPAGLHTIGSSPDSTVRIGHPTVSRQHATLEVSDSGVTVRDLGSSNGTRVDGQRANEPVVVTTSCGLTFGGVEARLEEVAAGDLEAAWELPSASAQRPRESSDDTAPTTLGAAALESFACTQLPSLVDRVEAGDDLTSLAQATGAALFSSLPCLRIEVVAATATESGSLFQAGRSGNPGGQDAAREIACGPVTLVAAFSHGAVASACDPILRAAAAVLRLAVLAGHPAPAVQDRTPRPPRLPDPPTVVNTVRQIYDQATRIARSTVSVLVRGESGTGKEILARYLHASSDRADGPFKALNCAALPRDLLEAELFGVEKGVATGVESRAGMFEAADEGTIFLDEIGDMAPETQAKILRVLQEGKVYRLGAHSPRNARVRVLSATNRDLDAMLADGRFRQDLYYRIADWVVELPPLRARRADIPNLAAHFLVRECARHGVRPAGISRTALEALNGYDWPGNIRQLEREMARAALFVGEDELLDSSILQGFIRAAAAGDAQESPSLRQILEAAERQAIEAALAQCDGDVPRAAERLQIGTSTLYRRMKVLGVAP